MKQGVARIQKGMQRKKKGRTRLDICDIAFLQRVLNVPEVFRDFCVACHHFCVACHELGEQVRNTLHGLTLYLKVHTIERERARQKERKSVRPISDGLRGV